MTGGTEFQEAVEAPKVTEDISVALEDLNQVSIEPEAAIEEGDYQIAEDLQAAFVATVPPVEPVQAVETTQMSPPVKETSTKEQQTAGDSGGKSAFGDQVSDPGNNYSGVELTQGEVLEDNDLNASSTRGAVVDAKMDAINETVEEAQQQFSEAAVQAAQDAISSTISAAGMVAEDNQVKEKDPQAPNLPDNTLASDETSSDLSSDTRPDFNNIQTVQDNIAGQTETVKGAVSGLKMANELIDQLENILDELQGETPEQKAGESEEDYQDRVNAYQKRVDDAQKDLDLADKMDTPYKDTSEKGTPIHDDKSFGEDYSDEERKRMEDLIDSSEQPSGGLIDFTAIAVEIEVGDPNDEAADAVMSAGAVTAPHVPGGSVVNAAMSGGVPGGESDRSRESEGSDSETEDPGIVPNPGIAPNQINYTAVQERWSGLFASGGVPMDINSLVQFVLRESYMETAKDLAFHADKVKMFNQTKTALRDHLTTIRDTAATLQDGDTLEIPVSSSEVSEDGSQVNVEQTLTLTKEEAQELLEVLDQPLENAGDQTTANEATDLSPIIGGSITVARAEAEIGASSSIGPGNQVEDISFENIDDLGEALSEAEGRIDALQDQIQDINDQINAEEANITGLLEIINEFTIGITEMQSWISDLISDIQILTDELEKMEDGDIRTITSRSLKLNPDGVTYSLVEKTVEMDYSEIQEEIVKKNAQITQVEEKIQEAKFRIEENKEYIEQGKEKIKGFERKINELQKEIAQVQEVIIQIQEQIAEYRENETK
jgi:hypothetical protein